MSVRDNVTEPDSVYWRKQYLDLVKERDRLKLELIRVNAELQKEKRL